MADYQNAEVILARLVQVGFVTDVNRQKRLARVKFPDKDESSDWMPVLINRDFAPDYDGEQRTGYSQGGSGEAAFESHAHELLIKPWMPKVNDQVLVLFLPVRNGDGFILGGIQPWR